MNGAVTLSPWLDERVVWPADRAPREGSFVLYWMRSALRGHENPALDVALELGAQLDRPVLVYQGLSERHPFACARHHTFILQGAPDVAAELHARGVAHALHVERPGHRGPHLRTLASRACMVVTEETPVEPLRAWTRALAEQVDAPVLRCDTSCVLPMPCVERPYDRAFAFRRATEKGRDARLREPWTDAPTARPSSLDELADALPFEPVDPDGWDLPALVARCDIDHSVGPVAHTRGGSAAGYARWDAFRRDGLARYARDRNDPLRGGVSRLSPYLHHGMVSPLRIAREAADTPGRGPEKFLDELLVWREVAHVFCFHHEHLDDLRVLPDWARETLADHAADPRPALHTWERLARGRTGDALWDATQRSLLVHGELHNNLRMTWGKALLGWTRDPQEALARLLDLNHRYALDGRDPASYGGLLWCLGALDRPFTPERPVSGRLRTRSTAEHARRLDVERYAARVSQPAGRRRRLVIVGGGLAGLTAARTLQDHGHEVVVLDKGRAPGGRCATRRHGDLRWDHGAQFFGAADPRVRRLVDGWLQDGVVARWEPRAVVLGPDGPRDAPPKERLVGVPGMSAVPRALAEDLDVRRSARVTALRRADDAWWVHEGEAVHGPFDACVLALPPAQAADLLEAAELEGAADADDGAAAGVAALARTCRQVRMNHSLTVLLATERPWELPFDAALDEAGGPGGVLAWAARDSSKPGRSDAVDTWVLQAHADWSGAHFDDEPQAVADALVEDLARRGGVEAPGRVHVDLMRWRYATPVEARDERCLAEPSADLVLCGDWSGGGRVGDALLGGWAAAGRLLGLFAERDAD